MRTLEPHVRKECYRHLGALGLNFGKLEADLPKARKEHIEPG